jgi:hypothetical protein
VWFPVAVAAEVYTYPLPFVCQLPRPVLASRVLPVAGVCAGGRRVFRHLYTRHVNTRKPVAASAVVCKRVRISLKSLWASKPFLMLMFFGVAIIAEGFVVGTTGLIAGKDAKRVRHLLSGVTGQGGVWQSRPTKIDLRRIA